MPAYEASNLNSIGLSFILIMGFLVFLLPRKLALLPLIITACYISLGQQLVIFVFHFSAFRLVLLFTWVRLFIRGEISAIKLNTIDKALIFWVISSCVISILRLPTSDTLVSRLGFVYNAIGLYFLFRFYIRDFSDIERLLKLIAIFIIPLAIAMLYEYSTGRNLFSIFGGVPEITEMRGDRFRCQGPFRHPILSGTFGATLVPVLLALWFKKKNSKLLAAAGIISATIIMVTSASSGPLMAYIFGIVGLLMWPIRKSMRAVRWGILVSLISLHLVMKAPVWFLLTRIADLVGGGGWHRAELIDQAISHLGDWWLLGTEDTKNWFAYTLAIDPNSADITNQFVTEGINGGLLTLILFIFVIIRCFSIIGLALKKVEESPFAKKIIIWALGASLFAHIMAFLSVSYFDQTIVFWFLLLAMISGVGDSLDVGGSVINTGNGTT